MRGGSKKQSGAKSNLAALFVWLLVQGAIFAGVLVVAWLILMPIDAGVEARILALEAKAESTEATPAMLRVYKMREAIGWSFPFLVIMLLLGVLLWSISITVREIAECRERLGMRR